MDKNTDTDTVAQQIWNDIKDRPIDMFSLPGQTPAKYCEPVLVEPSKLYLHFTVSAVLPHLEIALKNKYDVELVDQFITVAHKKA